MTDQTPIEGRNPDLERLNRFVGEWELEIPLDEKPISGGRETFEWLEDGAFLVQRSEVVIFWKRPPNGSKTRRILPYRLSG